MIENKFPQIYNPKNPYPQHALDILESFVLPDESLDKRNIYLIQDLYFILGIENLVGDWQNYILAFHLESNLNQ